MKEPSRSYSNKPRRRAYRHILAGLRYHRGENLSFITIGFKRGSTIDVRTVLHQLLTWIKRDKDFKIEFYRVTVWDNNSDDKMWRVHTHIIWNAPFIKQNKILKKVQIYVGESGSVHINLLNENDKKTARYLMQYLGNQDGFVRFSKSRGWLPRGYESVWKEMKYEFYEPVPFGVRKPLQDGDALFRLMTQGSDDWKREALVENMNAWLDAKRDNPWCFETIETKLFAPYLISYPYETVVK
jgi:hypothetical protein